MKIDYHIHTPLCNHAGGVMHAFVQQAIDIGFREICFLDHLTLRKVDTGLSMAPEEFSGPQNAAAPQAFWAIGRPSEKPDRVRDANSLYDKLEYVILPLFYQF